MALEQDRRIVDLVEREQLEGRSFREMAAETPRGRRPDSPWERDGL